jgi:hypothetical protein
VVDLQAMQMEDFKAFRTLQPGDRQQAARRDSVGVRINDVAPKVMRWIVPAWSRSGE